MKREVTIYGIEFEGRVIYVGQTKQDIFRRMYHHISKARSCTNDVPKFEEHIRKNYPIGIRRWDVAERIYKPIVLEVCSEENAYERESHWIATFDTIANGCNTIPSPGREKGCSNPSGEDHYLYGKPACQAAVAASVAARTGKKLSPEHIEKIRRGNAGKKYDQFAKPVICETTGQEFRTSKEAAKHFGVSPTTIKNLCKDQRTCALPKISGLVFKYKTGGIE